MTSHTQLWVYNSENCFVGLFYQFTCRVKKTKGLNDKPEFWDRLIINATVYLKLKWQSAARSPERFSCTYSPSCRESPGSHLSFFSTSAPLSRKLHPAGSEQSPSQLKVYCCCFSPIFNLKRPRSFHSRGISGFPDATSHRRSASSGCPGLVIVKT